MSYSTSVSNFHFQVVVVHISVLTLGNFKHNSTQGWLGGKANSNFTICKI